MRSYVIRGGRLTAAQRLAIEQYGSRYIVPYTAKPLNMDTLFPGPAPLTLEIGFGMGDSLLEMAIKQPQQNFLGIEVHLPGVGKLIHGIVQAGITNLKLIRHDAREVLQFGIAPDSLAGIQIFFPDPWHKKRHHKRRLIQREFVELLSSRLQSGGQLHLATDWEEYAQQMLEVLECCRDLRNSAGTLHFAPPGNRPVTKFERRGRKLGHGIRDLVFVKTDQ